jgi:hypothetical protein
MAVESANTVGVITHDIDPSEPVINVGICFAPVGDANGVFAVTNSVFGNDFAAGDTFYEFDANNWDLNIYSFNGVGQGWFAMYADGTGGSLDSLTIASGASLFLMGAAANFNITGQVRASGTQTVTFTPNDSTQEYVFPIVNPFPVATTFADLETFCSGGETLYVFNPTYWDLDIYTYNGAGQGWFAMYADGTGGAINDSTATILAAGQGASFMPTAACTWTKTLNY